MLAVELIHRLNRIEANAAKLSKLVARDACMADGKTPEAYEERTKLWQAIAVDAKALDGKIAKETRERAETTEGGN